MMTATAPHRRRHRPSSHDRGTSAAVLPAGLDADLLVLADQPQDHHIGGTPTVLERLHGRLRHRQRQQRQHFAQVRLELLADVFAHAWDVPVDEGSAHRFGTLADLLFIHARLLHGRL
jgi:hypothetical protein